MRGSKRLSWLLLLCISMAAAITLTTISSTNSLETRFRQPASVTDATPTPYRASYSNENYVEEPADAQPSLRVAFPADYREQFVQYATVDCPNSRIVRKMYVNPTVLDVLQTSETVPDGTVLVMETHAAQRDGNGLLKPTRLNNVFIREKRSGWRVNEDSGEWRSAWYTSAGSLVSNSQGSCIGCHTMVRDRDYLFTLPALLQAAKTGQKQRQSTEFGTSVCR